MPKEENNKGVIKRPDYKMAAQTGKNYLFVIGIDEYVHCPTLYNAVKDARDIVEVLQNRFRFEKENIRALYNQEATKNNIYKAFEFFAEKVNPTDNFLLYFSGHGEFKKLFNLGYWVPVEAEIDATHKFIPNSEVKNILSAIKSHHTFLMADSCFSGSLFAKGTGKNIPLRKERDPSRWGLTAGRNEIVTDGNPGENSPFAESILYQLRNADSPIGVAELCNKVLEVVAANADQTPRGEPLKIEGHKGGQFVFHLRMDEAGDWKNALATNTVTAFQSFVTKYPNSKNVTIAKGKMKALKGEMLWQKIENAKDNTISEVNNKLRLVNQYVDNYEEQVHYDEALNIGELLEYKKQFLQAQNSEFALRRFLRKPTPKVTGANLIKKTAQEKLANWDDTPIEVEEPAIVIPPTKKEIEEKQIITPTPKPTPVKPSPPESSFFEKYGKYLLFLLIPILGYGIYKAMDKGGSDIPLVNEERTSGDSPKTSTETVEEILPLELNFSWEKDLLITNIQGGEPPYFLQLLKGNKQKYSTQLNTKGKQEIPILEAYRADAGTYQLIIKDSKRNEVSKVINIDPPRISQAQKDYNQLIIEATNYYNEGDYEKALSKYKTAKGKVDKDSAARRGIAKCQNKLNEIEKQQQTEQERKTHDKAWLNAKSTNTITAYEAYQKKYPSGKYYKDATSQIRKIKQTAGANANSGTFKDSRDGQSYKWVGLKDGKKWMAQNLNYKTSDSWCYDDKTSNCTKYGRLYTWQVAKKACPSEWRLPTDDEWWEMASYYGKAYNSQSGQRINKEGDAGEAVYKVLMQGGNSGFSALLGGRRYSDGSFRSLSNYGIYWSSSESSSSSAWRYSFGNTNKHLTRYFSTKTVGLYCRCLQD